MKTRILVLSFIILFFNCKSQDCPQGINVLPMYGNAKKCKEQLESDKEFLAEMDKKFDNRKDAAKSLIKSGWDYFYKNDYNTSMKRFNQAWLINKEIYEIYWGFGNLVAVQGNPENALKYFDLAKKYNPQNSDFYSSTAIAYAQIYLKNNNSELLRKAIKDLETGLKIDPKNAKLYSLLSTSYFYLNDMKNAKAYFKKADEIDSSVINQEYRKIINSK
ncbi:hypothetical protein PQ459_06350 [Chryseobacterium sp. KACC 21268]|nr:hypothetical protein PQ459_06350 [Chryseobacterium sp. KACC 21268]